MHVNITVTVIVVAYMLIMLYIGWASSKRIKSNSDFMVAGRRLGPILMAGTLTATEIGGGSSLGVVQNGMSGYGLTSAWYIIAIGIAFIIMSFLAPMFRKTEIKTVPEYFRRRYGKGIGLITSIVTFIPLVGLTAGQFIAAAVVLSTMLGINYKMAVIITAGVVTAYSIMGGLWSVSITDNVQMVLIIFGMAIAIPFALSYAGGWSAVTANIPEGTLSLVGGENGGYDIISIIGLVVMYVATFSVGQEAVSRFYAAKDEKAAKQGAILSAICNFIYAFIPAVLGVIMLALINMGKFNAEDFASVGARYALPVLAAEVMPAIICGLLFAGIISATMSSSDSDLLGAGSVFANDIYKQFIRKDADSKEIMRVTQITMLLVGIFAMFIALFNTSSLLTILMFCFTLRAAGTFFPYVVGMYWSGASTVGTAASLISGTVVVVLIDNVWHGMIGSYKVHQSIIPGLIVAGICFFVFSKLFPPKNPTTEMAPPDTAD